VALAVGHSRSNNSARHSASCRRIPASGEFRSCHIASADENAERRGLLSQSSRPLGAHSS
jgi:hypothetical protein